MRHGAIKYSLTSWAASDDKFSNFIINKDEEWVGEGTEPPVWSGEENVPKLQMTPVLDYSGLIFITSTINSLNKIHIPLKIHLTLSVNHKTQEFCDLHWKY